MKDSRLNKLIDTDATIHKLWELKESLFIIDPETKKYDDDEFKIKMTTGKEYSANMLLDILNEDETYFLVEKLFNEDMEQLKVYFIKENGDYIKEFRFNRPNIIYGIKQVLDSNINIDKDKLKQKFDILKQYLYFESFINKNKDEIINIDIEGRKYKIKLLDIFNFIKLDEEEIYKKSKEEKIYGVPKEAFFYAAAGFFNVHNNLPSNYIIDKETKDKIKLIKDFQIVDVESLNQITEIDDFNFNNIKINSELKHEIIKDMPNNLNDLEKAMYVYIKMCKLLTYNNEFYALNQNGNIAKKHENINYLMEITPENNEAVCYEFNAIYEYIINELGIKFSTNQALLNCYGGGHANLKLRCGKFLVEVDSVISILDGDMTNAKINRPLNGFKCLNKNKTTKEEFNNSLNKVYLLILEQENKKEDIHVQTIEDLLEEYKKSTDNIKEVTMEEKLEILINKINSSNMVGVDSLTYLIKLRKILFEEEIKENKFEVTIIRNNNVLDEKKQAEAVAIISINRENDLEDISSNEYYYYEPNMELEQISLSDLKKLFEIKSLEYIGDDEYFIPGIQGGIKNDRKFNRN